LLKKPLDQIREEDLQALIKNAVAERKTLEYKQFLPSNTDSDKKEFLADVSSFANASGGDLIYGIVEEGGVPRRLEGLVIENVDQEKSRLESLIRDCIEPRIIGYNIESIKLSNSKVAFVIRIPKSWNGPHRVSFKGNDKFYSRNTNGKYPMDVTELRVAFTLSETVAEKSRRFREERVAKIYVNDTPAPVYETAKVVLHLVPFISFSPGQRYDISKVKSKFKTIIDVGQSRWNSDGLLSCCDGSYAQLYKNGLIEAVDTTILDPRFAGEKSIPCVKLEEDLIRSLEKYFSLLKELQVDPPIFCFLSLIGVKGYSMPLSREKLFLNGYHLVDRDILLIPEVFVEDYNISPDQVLKPCFDSIWNACGFSECPNYQDGRWKKPK